MNNYSTEEEIWKDVIGYEGYYKISDLGRVKSLPRNGTVNREIIMKPKLSKAGYLTIHLRKSGYSKHRKIHRLIAMAFIDKVEGKEIINHKDGNKLNNSISNLEWCTYKENAQHAHDTGLAKTDIKQIAAARAISIAVRTKRVKQLDMEGNEIREFASMTEARKRLNKTSSSMIARVCTGKAKSYEGFKWQYVN